MPLPNPNVFALFPLQEVIFNKDGTGPLAYGTVQFFSDPGFSVPKDVYEETFLPGGTITYTNLGNILTLSGIGSFVDLSGNNFIPLLYPFVGSPSDTIVGPEQLYYIQVYSSDGILQFTVSDWPPNVTQSGGLVTQEALTANLLTNPSFSIVSFIPTAGGTTYTYTTTGTQNFPVAPGWNLQSISTGSQTITVQQVALSSMTPNDAAYALQISWSTGVTSLQLQQTLTASPRLLAGFYASATIDCQCPNNEAVAISLDYEQLTTSVITPIVTGATPTGGSWGTIAGTKLIPLPASATAPASVEFIINITGLTPGSSVLIANVQMVEVANASITAGYIQQSTQQELNGLMWYYEPQLAYKPITNYALGWNFPFNPCQQYGLTGNSHFPDTALAEYYIDQTIVYQSTASSISYTVAPNGSSPTVGFNISNVTGCTYALVQYLDAAEAVELLNQRNSVKLRGYVSDVDVVGQSLIGTINLYYTTNVSPYFPALPLVMFSGFTGTGSAIAPTGLTAGWTIVPRQLGVASFNLTTTNSSFGFNGWDATAVSGINNATGFAIVISFNAPTLPTSPVSTTCVTTLEYITLCGGDIATSPAPSTIAQTRQGLKYYYETSWDYSIPVGTVAANGLQSIQAYTTSGTLGLFGQPISFQYSQKRVDPTSANPILYSTKSGAANYVTGNLFYNGAPDTITDIGATDWTLYGLGESSIIYTCNATASILGGSASGGSPRQAFVSYNYVIDARPGIV